MERAREATSTFARLGIGLVAIEIGRLKFFFGLFALLRR